MWDEYIVPDSAFVVLSTHCACANPEILHKHRENECAAKLLLRSKRRIKRDHAPLYRYAVPTEPNSGEENIDYI